MGIFSNSACASAFVSFLAVMSVLGTGNAASSSHAPSPAEDCSSVILSLVDCLSYVQEGGTASKPEGTCCSSLKKVVKTDVSCLCESFKSSASFGVKLNMTKALALPAACKVSTPPFSKCKISGGTGGAPAPSPASQFFTSAPVGSPLAGGGNAVGVPAPSPLSAGGAAAAIQVPVLALLASVAVMVLPCF